MMRFDVCTRHFKLTDDERKALEHDMQGLSRYFRGLTGARVVITKEKRQFVADLMLTGKYAVFSARAKGVCPIIAFGHAYSKTFGQLRKHFDKLQSRRAAALEKARQESAWLASSLDESYDDEISSLAS